MMVTSNMTINAAAYKSGYNPSGVATATFTNSITSTIGTGKIYYVAKTGSDSNSCTQAQNQSTPKLTIAAGIACLASGDTLQIKAGTYNERIQSNTNFFTNQSGTSWNNATTVGAFGSDTVSITGGISINSPVTGTEFKYIIIRNLILDGNNMGFGGGGNGGTVHHIKVDSVEIKNVSNTGIMVGGSDHSGSDIWITRTKVHDYNGTPSNQFHCWYVEGSRNIIEYSQCYNWSGGYGIHNYTQGGTASDNIYRYNWIYNVGNSASTVFGLILTVGDNNRAYNNLITNNANGVDIGSGSGNMVYNNTIQGNGIGTTCGTGTFCYNAVEIEASAVNPVFKNNIIYNNRINVMNNNGAGAATSNNLLTDPSFIDAASGNFNLKSGSSAIDKGTSSIASGITVSYVGAAPDIGALEYGTVNAY